MRAATKRLAGAAVIAAAADAAVSNTTVAQTWCEMTDFQMHVSGTGVA